MIIKKFDYKDKPREVIILYKSETSVAGIDLNYLTEEEKKEVKEIFKDSEPRNFSEMRNGKLEECKSSEKAEWMRAFRRFNLDTSELFKEDEENS